MSESLFASLARWLDERMPPPLWALPCRLFGHRWKPGPIIAAGRSEADYDECCCGAMELRQVRESATCGSDLDRLERIIAWYWRTYGPYPTSLDAE